MEVKGFSNYFEMMNFYDRDNVRNKSEKLMDILKEKIEKYIDGTNWKISPRCKEKVKGEKRYCIFIKNDSIDYEIGIEHFNPNFDDSKLRPDNIFCGRFYEQNKRGEQWSGKKYITNYKGVEMRTNSMEYVNLLLTEKMDDLVSHFFEEFKIYFNNNK